MARQTALTAMVLAAFMAVALAVVDTSHPLRPRAAQPEHSVTAVAPATSAAEAAQPGPLREVECNPGFGHGLAVRIDGERHCYREIQPSPSPSAYTSP